MTQPTERIIYHWSIAMGGGDFPQTPANRFVGYKDFNPGGRGWPHFIPSVVFPALENMVAVGLKPRVWLHQPFGSQLAGAEYDFCAATTARKTNPLLVEGFAESVKPLTRMAEVTIYVGSVALDNTLKPYLDNGVPRDAADRRVVQERMEEAYRIVRESGAQAVGFDSSNWYPSDHPAYELMVEEQANGRKVYLENWPLAERPHLFGFSRVAAESDYQSIVAGTAGQNFAPAAKLTGDCVRIMDPTSYAKPGSIKAILKDGHSAAIYWKWGSSDVTGHYLDTAITAQWVQQQVGQQ